MEEWTCPACDHSPTEVTTDPFCQNKNCDCACGG